MEEGLEKQPGLNILCIDGGGVRGLSSLLLLSEAMARIQVLEGLNNPPRPCEYFDVIAGTGTGALAACMLGRLELPIQQAINCYGNLAKNVFSDRKWVRSGGFGAFKSGKLREEIKSIIKETTRNEHEPMVREIPNVRDCRTIIFAMSQNQLSTGIPTAFRSYQGFANQAPDCAIWEAICASMAHPDLFKSIAIGVPPLQESFVGGGLACNNPLAHVLSEVKAAYPERYVASVISIGAGHTDTIRLPGSSWLNRLLPTKAINAMKAIAIDSERVAEQMASRFKGTTGVYFRFNVDQGVQGLGLSNWERFNEVSGHVRTYMLQGTINWGMDSAVRAIRNRGPALPTHQIDGEILVRVDSAEQSAMKRCPVPTPAFTGHRTHLKQVESCILTDDDDRRVCVVHGIGGAGKTQLVRKIIERTRERWKAIVYLDASSRGAIESTLQGFAMANNIGETHEDTLRWLESRKRWLLVFDNADAPTLNIPQFFPRGNYGSIIITTRLRDMVTLALGPNSDCRVSSMDPQDAFELLMKTARVQVATLSSGDMAAGTALLEDFGHLALAIVHAGTNIEHSRISLSKYRELFLSRRRTTLESYSDVPVEPDNYQRSVFTTWNFCYDLLGPNARMMIGLTAFLHYDGVIENIFRLAATNMQCYEPQVPFTDAEATALETVREFLGAFLDSEGRWDSLAFLNTVNEVLRYSLLEHDRVNQAYRMNVLVQDWARTLALQQSALALESTIALLSLSIDDNDSTESHNFRRMLELHVTEVLQIADQRQLTISPNHEAPFALVYFERGQWRKSEELQTRVMDEGKRTLGDKHPFTLTAKADLAMTYWKQGRWSQAETLEVEVVAERSRLLGAEHPHTLVAKANLAATFRKQGRWDEAEQLQLAVMESRSRTLGDRHPDVLTAKSNLAATFQNQGRWNEAERLQIDVLNGRERALGEEHPHTLDAKAKLAATYRKQGRWQETERLEVEIVAGTERVLGEEHPHTLIAKGNLATTYGKKGLWDKAEELEVGVVEAMKRILGEEHPHLWNAKANLAATYRKQGRWDEAERLQLEVVAAMKQALGDTDLHTLEAKSNLAMTFKKQGRWGDAERLQVEVMEAMKHSLGDKHPDTLTSKANLSSVFQKQGRWEEAEKLQVEVVGARTHALGVKHPDTLVAKANLAVIFWNQGRKDEARKLQAEVVQLSEEVLGTNHPHTLQHERTLHQISSETVSTQR